MTHGKVRIVRLTRTSYVSPLTNHNVGCIIEGYAEYIPLVLRIILGGIRTSNLS